MKKLLSILIGFLVIVYAGAALAATGTIGTETLAVGTMPSGKKFVVITVPWTSTAGGAFSCTSDELLRSDASTTYTTYVENIMRLTRMVTDPGATAPTDNYDITITTDDGEDILGGEGANRDTATTESVTPASGNAYVYPRIRSKFTINITNAGASKQGTIILYFEE